MRGGASAVLYVAFDACDPGVARRLAADGTMPVLAGLLGEAAIVPTKPPVGLWVSALWPTLFTALRPDHHDYACWLEIPRGGYDHRQTTPRDIHGTPFWERLSVAGRRVAVLDVPHALVNEGLNGVQLVEWGCHDRHLGTASWPADLVDDLNARFGPHPIGCAPEHLPDNFSPCDYVHRAGPLRTPDEAAALWADIVEGQRRKAAVSLHLLEQGEWDLFLTVLGESHCTGHQLWHVHDRDHARHDRALAGRIGDPIREIYARLDATLGAHLELVAPDAPVFVQLSHGMGPHYDGTHLLDAVLRRMEQTSASDRRRGWRSRLASAVVDRLPAPLRTRTGRAVAPLVRRRIANAPPAANENLAGVDRASRPWFAVPNNTVVGGVRVNVPEAAVDEACDRVTAMLSELVNVDTGEPVVRDVIRTDRVYDVRSDHPFPDLLVEWNRRAPIERVYSPRLGTVVEPYTNWRTGDHTEEGMLLVRAPSISPGPRPAADVVDIAPTVCAALGVSLDAVDGRPLTGLVPALAEAAR